MDIESYLARIQYTGPLTVNADTLAALHEAHLMAVPFENLSIHLDEPIVLEDEALFNKVVGRNRGGFCYELNGLFAALLRGLGFQVVMLSANVSRGAETYTPDHAHMALMVLLEERWLVDVGFGDNFRRPLRIDSSAEQWEEGASYTIIPENGFYILRERKEGGEWMTQYRFTLKSHQYADYAARCLFYQSSPESHFRSGRVCSRLTPDGRITVREMKFIRSWVDGRREESTLEDEAAFRRVLQEEFSIDLGRASL